MFETARLCFARWQRDDWRPLRPIAQDPQVMRYISNGEPWADERIREFVRRQIAGYALRGFCFWRLLLKSGFEAAGRDRKSTTDPESYSPSRFPSPSAENAEPSEMIGFCGLQPLEGTAEVEIGWWLARSWWGKGLATEAARASLRDGFERVGLRRIVAIAQPENRASLHIMDKLNMRFERETTHRGLRVVLYRIGFDAYATARGESNAG